jgi:hypothetical protein
MKKFLKSMARYFGYEIRQIPGPPTHVVFDDSLQRDREFLRAFATRAADLAGSPQATEAIRYLHLSGIFKEQLSAELSHIEIGGPGTPRVGIWKRESAEQDAAFVRSLDRLSEGFYWAETERIEPKRSKWRVALLGESVARGYMYDPQFNLASTLEGMLRAHMGAKEIDVVDLAKSNQTMSELKAMVGQSLALRPDVIVIFAGNNWRPHLNEEDIPYVQTVLRTEGVPGMKAFLDAEQEQRVRLLVGHVKALLGPRGVKVIWIVPEFNLADWNDPASDAPLLKGQRNRLWRVLSVRAGRALAEGDLALAETAATQMVSLDGGTNAIPLRILAECRRLSGDPAGARRYLEMCRDAGTWDPSFALSPRVSSTIQNALRQAASAHDNIVIDVPDMLNQRLNGAVPGRKIFVDYCHLTAEGMTLCMAAAASKIVTLLTGRVVPPRELESKAISPRPEIEGKACLLAAVHNAHFYQGYELVHYWCARALQFWPEGAEIMTRFIDMQTRRVPTMACKSTTEMFNLDKLGTLRYLLRGGRRRIDLVLSRAIVDSVRAIGRDIGEQLAELRYREHSVGTVPKELTDFYYSSAMLGPAERAWTSQSFSNNRWSPSLYGCAFSEKSKFIFFREKGRKVGLRFTCRIPTLSGFHATVGIEVNGHGLAQAPVGPTWRTTELLIPTDYLVDGINEVLITWPDDEDVSDLLLERAADAIVTQRLPYFYPIFGEIHSLTAYTPADATGDLGSARSSRNGVSPTIGGETARIAQRSC